MVWTKKGTSIITYSTGVLTLTTGTQLQTSAKLGLNYSTSGWAAGGTGLEDEDGSNSWTGASSTGTYINAVTKPNHATNTAYVIGNIVVDTVTNTWQYATTSGTTAVSAPAFSSTAGVQTVDGGVTWDSEGKPVVGSGGDWPASTANQAWAVDVSNWLTQFAAQALRSDKLALNKLFPDLLYFGQDELGGYATPARPAFMIADNVYADVGFNFTADTYLSANAADEMQYMTHYLTIPLFSYEDFDSTQSDAPCAFGGGPFCFATQQGRGQEWYNLNNFVLNQVGYNGVKAQAGLMWWGSDTFQGASWGLRDITKDNAYDGNEDVAASVSCSAPNGTLTCGGESGSATFLGANGILCAHCVKDGNGLWFANAPPPVIPTVPTGKQPMLAKHDGAKRNHRTISTIR